MAAALGIVRELKRIREVCGTALLLISHEENIVAHLHPREADCVYVTPRGPPAALHPTTPAAHTSARTGLAARTRAKMADYLCYSLPLVGLAFIAAGFAISMLFADVLVRTDVTDQIVEVSGV
jgi:hypothetical protein